MPAIIRGCKCLAVGVGARPRSAAPLSGAGPFVRATSESAAATAKTAAESATQPLGQSGQLGLVKLAVLIGVELHRPGHKLFRAQWSETTKAAGTCGAIWPTTVGCAAIWTTAVWPATAWSGTIGSSSILFTTLGAAASVTTKSSRTAKAALGSSALTESPSGRADVSKSTASGSAGSHFVCREFAVLVAIQSLESFRGVCDFFRGNLIVLIGVECGHDRLDASECAATATQIGLGFVRLVLRVNRYRKTGDSGDCQHEL
jgi:hypothetical protein